MTAKISQRRATWWKAGRYVIERGLIRPAPEAEFLPVDPWGSYQTAMANFVQSQDPAANSQRPPYLDLLDLERKIRTYTVHVINQGKPDQDVPDDIAAAITSFCATYGLLGLLHHRAVQIVQPGSESVLYRQGGHWLVDAHSWAASYSDCLILFGDNSIESISFEDIQQSYFGTERSSPSPIPHPASQEFFEYYTEPVYEFLRAIYQFSEVIDLDLGWDFVPNPSLNACNSMLSRVSTELRLEGGTLVQEPVYASLLAAFADMALRDTMAGLRLGRCECCGQILVTNYQRTKYCSVQCRWRVVKQRSRSKAAENKRKKTGRGK